MIYGNGIGKIRGLSYLVTNKKTVLRQGPTDLVFVSRICVRSGVRVRRACRSFNNNTANGVYGLAVA